METRKIHEYHKIMNRPLSLIDCQCWDIGERKKMPEKYENLLFFDPLFIYTPMKGVAVYYNFTDANQDFQPLIDFLEERLTWFKKEKYIFDKDCEKIRKIIQENNSEADEFSKLIKEIWPTIAVASALCNNKFYHISDDLKDICVKIRNESDDVLHPGLVHLNEIISQNFKIDNTQNITLFEALSNDLPSSEELNRRKKGWMYHRGRIIHDSEKYLREKNILIINPFAKESSIIFGNVACKGLRTGKARIVFELPDLEKVKDGDIIVTPMTVPEMIPVLKKVSAILTDEGGITCHAAIVSRELRIPCIIGTKNATQTLKDGDLLEVDANKGEVKILKEH